jgi:hypothetical protein
MKPFALCAILALAAGVALGAQAEPTRLMVRAHSADAKFIGTMTGGVEVTLTEAATGKVLAKGAITGGTGDTQTIIRNPHVRGTRLTDDKTAGFEATLDIDKPTLVNVSAHGPVGKPSAITVTSSLWMLPGRHVLGDGWVLEFPGLTVEPTTTPGEAGQLKVAAKVGLMCGCPIEPGGLWAAENYTVEASLLSGGKVVANAPLAYAGAPSQFAGTLPKAPAGRYVLRVRAADAKTPNAGVVEQPVEVR